MDVQDEGRKERRVLKPKSCHEVKACLCLFSPERKHMPGLFRLSSSPVFSKSSWSLSFLSRLLSLASELDFLVCWFCMAPAGLTTRERSLLSTPNTPVIGLIHMRCFMSVLMTLADVLSHSSRGRFGCTVSSLKKPENGMQSTRLFFVFTL